MVQAGKNKSSFGEIYDQFGELNESLLLNILKNLSHRLKNPHLSDRPSEFYSVFHINSRVKGMIFWK